MEAKGLQTMGSCGKLTVKDGWVMCPVCGRGKVLKVREDTEVKNLEVCCKLCRRKSVLNIKSLSQSRSASA
jgi:uncharacterized Zn finger protein (UPF0148 family)